METFFFPRSNQPVRCFSHPDAREGRTDGRTDGRRGFRKKVVVVVETLSKSRRVLVGRLVDLIHSFTRLLTRHQSINQSINQ